MRRRWILLAITVARIEGHDTAEVRNVRRTGGGRGMCVLGGGV